MLNEKYENMTGEKHSSGLGINERSDEILSRPDDTNKIKDQSSVHYSLENIEEDGKFAKTGNG
jgi:hypothetical protein